jgi:hypothetical protein
VTGKRATNVARLGSSPTLPIYRRAINFLSSIKLCDWSRRHDPDEHEHEEDHRQLV